MLAVFQLVDCFHLHATIFEVIGRNLRASESQSEAKKRFLPRQAKIKSTSKPTESYPWSMCGHCWLSWHSML